MATQLCQYIFWNPPSRLLIFSCTVKLECSERNYECFYAHHLQIAVQKCSSSSLDTFDIYKILYLLVLGSILFADDQVIFSSSEDGLQMAAHKLEQATIKINLKISTTKTKSMGFQGKEHMRTWIIMNGKLLEQV